VSTPGREGYIVGTAKNWVANAGGLRKFKALFGQGVTPFVATEPSGHKSYAVNVPEEICKAYLQSRKEADKGFTTKLTMVETGSYKGKPFGIVQKPSGARWAIGVLTKEKRTVAVPMGRLLYRTIDKATKGQRMTCEVPVFDPQG
jgi:hypothetical protein